MASQVPHIIDGKINCQYRLLMLLQRKRPVGGVLQQAFCGLDEELGQKGHL